MPSIFGGNIFARPYLGSVSPSKIYLGSTQVYPAAPAYVGVRTNPFDPFWSTYNLKPESTVGIRAAMATVATARVKISLRGHSTMAGVGATPGTNDMARQLRNLLFAGGKPIGGTGMVPVVNNTTLDSRYTAMGTGWAQGLFPAPFRDATNQSGASFTFVSDVAGTVVDIVHLGNSGTFTVKIDSAAAVSVTPTGTAAVQTRSFTGLTNTTHTVVVTSTSAGSVYMVGVGVRGTTGIEITNSGLSSSQAEHWAPTHNGSSFFNLYTTANLGAGTPSIVGIQLDVSDVLAGVSAATFKTSMQAQMTALQTAGIPMFLIASGHPFVAAATWNTYLTALYDLADQYNVPLVDTTFYFSGYNDVATAKGYMADTAHPNATGYSKTASGVHRVLTYV